MTIRLAIIGAGPAGFYLCDRLLKKRPDLYISLFEAGIHPFGLVRYGVAPDHPEIKLCTNRFSEIGSSSRVSFFGNIRAGIDLPIEFLHQNYDFVVQCTGASRPRSLNIPGSELCITSDRFIGWINGSPESRNFNSELQNITRVAIIGNGNVALDVLRLLSKSPESLRKTDISSKALNSLLHSNISEIHLIGRRGLENVSFTAKEFREITGVSLQFAAEPNIFTFSERLTQSSKIERRIQRIAHFIVDHSSVFHKEGDLKKCLFHFNSIPLAVKQETGNRKVLELSQNGNRYVLFPDLIITCLGYENRDEPDWPHIEYKSGWARQGAKGTLASSLANAQIVADAINSAIESANTSDKKTNYIQDYFKSKGLLPMTWKDHTTLDALEREEGQSRGKIREKCLDHGVQLAQIYFRERI